MTSSLVDAPVQVAWFDAFKADTLQRIDADVETIESVHNKKTHAGELSALRQMREFVSGFDPERPYSVRPPGLEKAIRFITMPLVKKEIDWLKTRATMVPTSNTKIENMFIVCAQGSKRTEFMKEIKAQKLYGEFIRALLDEWPEGATDERWIWIYDTT